MPATADQLSTFQSDGYTMIESLVPRDLIDAAWQRVQEIVEGEHDWEPRHFQKVDPAKYTNSKGEPMPIGIQQPAAVEEVFSAIADHPNLKQAFSEILGGEVTRFTDQIGVKHGCITEEQGGRSFYHQDSYYWRIKPELGCNVWIPLCPVDKDAIALGIMPGSQQDGKLVEHEDYFDDPSWFACGVDKPLPRHRIPDRLIDYSGELIFPMQPGDGLFFGNYTWHRSEPNRTGETKAFYAIAYRRADVEDYKAEREQL